MSGILQSKHTVMGKVNMVRHLRGSQISRGGRRTLTHLLIPDCHALGCSAMEVRPSAQAMKEGLSWGWGWGVTWLPGPVVRTGWFRTARSGGRKEAQRRLMEEMLQRRGNTQNVLFSSHWQDVISGSFLFLYSQLFLVHFVPLP